MRGGSERVGELYSFKVMTLLQMCLQWLFHISTHTYTQAHSNYTTTHTQVYTYTELCTCTDLENYNNCVYLKQSLFSISLCCPCGRFLSSWPKLTQTLPKDTLRERLCVEHVITTQTCELTSGFEFKVTRLMNMVHKSSSKSVVYIYMRNKSLVLVSVSTAAC